MVNFGSWRPFLPIRACVLVSITSGSFSTLRFLSNIVVHFRPLNILWSLLDCDAASSLSITRIARISLEFPPLSICVNIYALRLGSYYFNPTEYRGMNIAHPLCAGYKNRLLIYTYAQCAYPNHDLALNWYM